VEVTCHLVSAVLVLAAVGSSEGVSSALVWVWGEIEGRTLGEVHWAVSAVVSAGVAVPERASAAVMKVATRAWLGMALVYPEG